jgi:hypothetical protein
MQHPPLAQSLASKQYSAKFPKAVAKVVDDEDVLLAFYDFPAEHWIHLRTTNRHDPSADWRATAVVVPVGEIRVPSGNVASRFPSTMIRAVSPPIWVNLGMLVRRA